MGVPPDAQFASYRHTSAKTPLSPVLTSLFHRKLDQLSKIQAVPTPRFTRDRCGSGNQNGVLFRTLQHADRLLELASAEFATRPRTGVRGVAADVWQAEAQQAEARFLARNRPASGSALRVKPEARPTATDSGRLPKLPRRSCKAAV